MCSKDEHRFREWCLNLLADYPEAIFSRNEEGMLLVNYVVEAKHHIFAVTTRETDQITHMGTKAHDAT